jgi:hypothetical protein
MNVQEVKIFKFSDLSSDLRMIIVKDDKPILEDTKFIKYENAKLPKILKVIINSDLEVEETTTNK